VAKISSTILEEEKMREFLMILESLAGRLTRIRVKGQLDGNNVELTGDLADPVSEVVVETETPQKGVSWLKVVALLMTLGASAWGGFELSESKNQSVAQARAEVYATQKVELRNTVKVLQRKAQNKDCVSPEVAVIRMVAERARMALVCGSRLQKQARRFRLSQAQRWLKLSQKKKISKDRLRSLLVLLHGEGKLRKLFGATRVRYVYLKRRRRRKKRACKKIRKDCPPSRARPVRRRKNRKPRTVLVKK